MSKAQLRCWLFSSCSSKNNPVNRDRDSDRTFDSVAKEKQGKKDGRILLDTTKDALLHTDLNRRYHSRRSRHQNLHHYCEGFSINRAN